MKISRKFNFCQKKNFERRIGGAGHQQSAVRGPRNLVDGCHMAAQRSDVCARSTVPKLDGFVEGSGGDQPRVRRKLDLKFFWKIDLYHPFFQKNKLEIFFENRCILPYLIHQLLVASHSCNGLLLLRRLPKKH